MKILIIFTLILNSLFNNNYNVVYSQVINLRTKNSQNDTWIEVGSTFALSEWTLVKTNYKQFIDPIVILSSPLGFKGQDYIHPIEGRMKNLQITNGEVSFQVKQMYPNDTSCSKQWWIPTYYPHQLNLSWVVIEKGGYSINGTQIVTGASTISGYITKVDWEFSFGSSCHYPSEASDNDFAPGGIFELQTTNNVGSYLSARTTQWWYKGESNKCSYSWTTGRFFLEPHEGYPYDDKFLLNTERVGYLLYDPKPHMIDCLDGSRFEFSLMHGLTNTPSEISLRVNVNPKTSSIGFFSSVNGYTGGDSSVVRTFYNLSQSLIPYIYLQEDQCYDEEMIHLPESVSLLVISAASSHCPLKPVVTLYSEAPTTLPTSVPTITHSPSIAPTENLLDNNRNNPSKEDSNYLLAIILPIVILVVIAAVGLVTRAYFASSSKGEMIPSSDHSGNNLVFDT